MLLLGRKLDLLGHLGIGQAGHAFAAEGQLRQTIALLVGQQGQALFFGFSAVLGQPGSPLVGRKLANLVLQLQDAQLAIGHNIFELLELLAFQP